MEPANPLVILNPMANRGTMQQYRALIHRYLEQHEAAYVETSQQGEAQELARQAALAGRSLVIVGGDGSINEVVNGILTARRRVPLGIVAAGSGNDFARSALGLPLEPLAALECAFNGRLVDVDAGCLNGRYFANGFSVGLDADIAARADALKKYPLMSGTRLYYASVLRQLFFGYQRCPWLTFHLDDGAHEDEIEKRYILIAVSNGPSYGAGFRINPTANHTDGLLDVCTINYAPLLRALRLLPIVKKGLHASLPEVTFYRARTLHIASSAPVMCQTDGETTLATRFDAEIVPGALCIRV